MKEINSCKDCEWCGEPVQTINLPAHCRRNPPQSIMIGGKHELTGQPLVTVQAVPAPLMPYGVCGEYKPKVIING